MVQRRSSRTYDLDVHGVEYRQGGPAVFYHMWLPRGAIGWLTDWGRGGPEIDFGNLDAGWSALQDSDPTTIWRIFADHVEPLIG
jgi:hypothetical protein